MNQEVMLTSKPLLLCPARKERSKLIDIVEILATKGDWTVPPFKEVTLATTLSDVSLRDVRRRRTLSAKAGTVSICELNESRSFEMSGDVEFAVVLLQKETLEQAREENGQPRDSGMQVHDVLPDPTLCGLMNVLVHERHEGYQSGLFFLDSVGTALASYLVRHYSVTRSIDRSLASTGMTPSMLRRCIDFMEAHFDGELRLSELANEVRLSTSHLIRSFRETTGKTPYQFLLHRRVERAKVLMRDQRASLTEVGLASGFADQHHLARVFRRVTGMTPSSYRRSL